MPDLVAKPRRAKRQSRSGRQAVPKAARRGALDGRKAGAIMSTSPGSEPSLRLEAGITCLSDSVTYAPASADEGSVATADKSTAEHVYKITPWAIRVGAPIVVLVLIAGLRHGHDAALIPLPIVFAVVWVWSSERCRIVTTSVGLESRMNRARNCFQYAWGEIDGFELLDNQAQVAIAVRLKDGSHRMLPSTRAWRWDKSTVQHILDGLTHDCAAAVARTPGAIC